MRKLLFVLPLLLFTTLGFASEKCSSDVELIASNLSEQGFEPLLYSEDKFDSNIVHVIAFNMQTNNIISFDNISKNKVVVEICFNFTAQNPEIMKKVFDEFRTRKHINAVTQNQQEYLDAVRKHAIEEHEPYQGNPFKASLKE